MTRRIGMKRNHTESGQILLGGLFFLFLVISISFYFISVSDMVDKLYSTTLKSRFDTIQKATKYANIFNQITINNQLIVTEIMSAQIAYISAIESGLTLSNQQPYWETYSNFQDKNNVSALSEKSFKSIENSFSAYARISGRAFYAAKSLASQNDTLINQLPETIKTYLSRSTNAFVHCLALEIQNHELKPSHYLTFNFPSLKPLGVTKTNCDLYDKNSPILTKITHALPMLTTNDNDLLISFNKIDDYLNFDNTFSYGISYVTPELSDSFMNALKFDSVGTLQATVRISHPEFSCSQRHNFNGDFVLEQDWKNFCELSIDHFLKSFFKPNWAALVTHQDARIQYK